MFVRTIAVLVDTGMETVVRRVLPFGHTVMTGWNMEDE